MTNKTSNGKPLKIPICTKAHNKQNTRPFSTLESYAKKTNPQPPGTSSLYQRPIPPNKENNVYTNGLLLQKTNNMNIHLFFTQEKYDLPWNLRISLYFKSIFKDLNE